MLMSNKLVIIRDKYKYSQQQVADAIGVSKSTYCRYEQGKSSIGLEEVAALLELYGITYEELVGVNFPIEHIIVYPPKLLDSLEKAILNNSQPDGNYYADKTKYNNIKEALEPIMHIRNEAMSFPDIDINSVSPGTTVKSVKLDIRGEKLIEAALRTMHILMESMMKCR